MKLFINKNKFVDILQKEIPNKISNNEENKLSLLNSKSIQTSGRKEIQFFTFQEFFKISTNDKISITAKHDKRLINKLDKKFIKQFSYLGSKKNYKFYINQIYSKNNTNLVVEFKFNRK